MDKVLHWADKTSAYADKVIIFFSDLVKFNLTHLWMDLASIDVV